VGFFKRALTPNLDDRNARLRGAVLHDVGRTSGERLISDDYRYIAGVVDGHAVGLVDWWLYVETPHGIQASHLSAPHEAKQVWRDIETKLGGMILLDPGTDIVAGLRPSDRRYRLVKGLAAPDERSSFDLQKHAAHKSGLLSGWGYLAPAGGRHFPWLIVGFRDRIVSISVPPETERNRPDVARVVDLIDEASADLSRADAVAPPMLPKHYRSALAGENSYIEVADVIVGRVPASRHGHTYSWGRHRTARGIAWVFVETSSGAVAMPMPSERQAETVFATLRDLQGSSDWYPRS